MHAYSTYIVYIIHRTFLRFSLFPLYSTYFGEASCCAVQFYLVSPYRTVTVSFDKTASYRAVRSIKNGSPHCTAGHRTFLKPKLAPYQTVPLSRKELKARGP